MIRIGSKLVTKLFLGNKVISKMYLGTKLVFGDGGVNPPPLQANLYINKEDGEVKTLLWTKGITPPKLGKDLTKEGGSDFTRMYIPTSNDVIYDCPYQNGWYDCKKDPNEPIDDNLCFLAVATNALYWWVDRNKQYINKYILENKQTNTKLTELLNGPKTQINSSIWRHYLTKFGLRNTGYWPDAVEDNFINGYRFKIDVSESYANDENNEEDGLYLIQNGPDNTNTNNGKPMCGFFYDVFKNNRLSYRTIINPSNINNFDNIVINSINNGELLGIVFRSTITTFGTHVVSIWGIELNKNGSLEALFVCDNNDEATTSTQIGVSMKRLMVVKRDNMVYLTTKKDKSGGAQVTTLNHLKLGDTYFELYFNNSPKYPCTGISFDKTNIVFTDKQLQTINVTLQPSNCDEPVIWSPKESSIVSVENGVVTPHNNGNAIVRATCGKFNAECNVLVNISSVKYPCTGVSLYPWTLKFFPPYDKNPKQLEVGIQPENCDESRVWSTSVKGIVDVSTTGLVTPLKRGRTEIKLTCGNYNATSDVIVDFDPGPIECTGITVYPTSLNFKEEAPKGIFITVTPNTTNQPINAEIENPSIASVNTDTWEVTPISDGNTRLKLTCGNQITYCDISVGLPKEGTVGCKYFAPKITMNGVKARLELDGYVEEFDVAYTPNTGHPNYAGYKLILADGETYYLSLLNKGTSLFAIDGKRPDSGAWTRDFGFAHISMIGFTEEGSLDCGIQNLNNTVNTKLILMGFDLVNQSFKGLNFHLDNSSKNTVDVGSYEDTWLGLNVMSNDHMNIHFNGPKLTYSYGGVTDARYPLKNGINRLWLSTFVHECGHSFGIPDLDFNNPAFTPSLYDYHRDRSRCLYLQPNDLKYIQDYILKDWGKQLIRVLDLNLNAPIKVNTYSTNSNKEELFFDFFEGDYENNADCVLLCNLSFNRKQKLDIGYGLLIEYDIYDIVDETIIKGNISNREIKIPTSLGVKINKDIRYELSVSSFINTPNSIVNPKYSIKILN